MLAYEGNEHSRASRRASSGPRKAHRGTGRLPLQPHVRLLGAWPFLQYSANNVGDPFHDSNFRPNSHEIEREVVHLFADLMRIERDQAWGYVTSGGTEGNMYGLYMGRELFPDGVVYFSQDTHYSVVKILSVLKAAKHHDQEPGERPR